MQEIIRDENKPSHEIGGESMAILLELQREHNNNPFYIHRDKTPYSIPQFYAVLEGKLNRLREEGLVKMEHYIRPWYNGEPNKQQIPDPNVIQVTLLPKAEMLLRSRTVERTEKITETFQELQEPPWKENKRLRAFARTERGCAIISATPEAAVSDVRGTIEVLRRGGQSRAEWKARQMWLKYWLIHRFSDIPEHLRSEAEYFRDLPYSPRRRNDTK